MSRLHAERESELASIWGTHVVKRKEAFVDDYGGPDTRDQQEEIRMPKRRQRGEAGEGFGDDVLLEDEERGYGKKDKSDLGKKGKKNSKKDAKKKAEKVSYKLHCFVAPGTTKNEVRELFEDYEPKVDLRVSQKGNLLNKTHYCVLTFPNKAMGLHAVKRFQGTDQMNTIGMRKTHLGIMRSRQQNKKYKKKATGSA